MTTEVATVNHYGARALAHWRTHLPGRLAQISDQEAFFTQLGQTAEQQISDLAESLEEMTPPGEGYLEEVARLQTARMTAESQVMRELLLIDPADQEKIAQLLA
jgi:hypothetical protein